MIKDYILNLLYLNALYTNEFTANNVELLHPIGKI